MKYWKAHAAVIAANILFGINFSTVQFITKKAIAPFGLNVIRVGVSTLLLWIVWLFSATRMGIRKEHIGRFLLCAITGIVINQSLFIKGLSMTLSIHAALLILVTPVFISIAAAWTGSEPMTVFKTAGLITAITGAVMLALQRGGSSSTGSDIMWGDLCIILNAISYAIYFVLVKPLMLAYNPEHVIRWIFTFGLLFTVPIGWTQFAAIRWESFGWAEYSATAFIAIGATFLAYLFNLYGIHRLGASITGTYIYTQPFFASLIAVFVLHEVFSGYKWVAAALIISGVILVSHKPKEKLP